jgi:hypothetical protein
VKRCGTAKEEQNLERSLERATANRFLPLLWKIPASSHPPIMEAAAARASYSRTEWANLSIQERIRAMNQNMTTAEAQGEPEPPATAATETTQATTSPEDEGTAFPLALPQNETRETPKRASVVEMWRRRDQSATPPTKSSPARVDRIEASREEEKKDQEDQEEQDAAASVVEAPHKAAATSSSSSVVSVASVQSRSTSWSNPRGGDNYQAPKRSVVSPSMHKSGHRWKTGAPSITTTAATAKAETDMTIVPSPSQSPSVQSQAAAATAAAQNEDSSSVTGAPPAATSTKSRPASVVDFWAQRGLKPIQSGDASVTQAPTSTEDTSMTSSTFRRHQPTAQLKSASPSAKVSVVDRWKQRANPQAEEAAAVPVVKKPVSARWTSAVQKPVQAVVSSRANKVTDRWLNRSAADTATKDGSVTGAKTSSIPSILQSSTSKTAMTTSTSSSWPNREEQDEEEDEESLAPSVSKSVKTTATEQSQQSSHVTKRWSNRLGTDSPTPTQKSTCSLPAPKRKTDAGATIATPAWRYASNLSAPSTPRTPDVSKASPWASPKSLTSASPMSPNLKFPNLTVSTAQSPKPRGKAVGQWATLPIPTTPTTQDAPVSTPVEANRLLVLMSGQSLSREQASIRHQMSTILQCHEIPYDEVDGSDPTKRERRNELFKLSGLHAKYPQLFIQEDGETKFWGTWDTLQQCNDAGMLVEEFGPKAVAHTEPDVEVARAKSSRPAVINTMSHQRIQQFAELKTVSQERMLLPEPEPELCKSPCEDDDAESASVPTPVRASRSAFDMYGVKKLQSPVVLADKKRSLARKHMGGSNIKWKIDEDAVLEDSSVQVDGSVMGMTLAGDDACTVNSAMEDSLTVHTMADSVTTNSTAPRLGAKSLDSLKRRDIREFGDTDIADMDAILQPMDEDPDQRKPSRSVLASWPPKLSYDALTPGRKGAASPKLSYDTLLTPGRLRTASPKLTRASPSQLLGRSFSPSFHSSLPASPSPSRASPARPSPASSLHSPRARRIGQRLLEKKRELQAHRQRLKKSRSSDSNDCLSTGMESENQLSVENVHKDSRLRVDEDDNDDAFRQTDSHSTQKMRGSESRRYDSTDSSFSYAASALFQKASEVLSPRHQEADANSALTLSRDNVEAVSSGNEASWFPNSAFSPLNQGAPSLASFHSAASHARPDPESSKKNAICPHSEGSFSFLEVRSEGSTNSKGSALSLRAEKLLKQRRRHRTLSGVDEGIEFPEERKHAHQLARNVVYGSKQKVAAAQHSTEKAKKWNQLRVDADTNNMFGELSSMTRQRAGLSSRYTTSARFMEHETANAAAGPPTTTKSLPGKNLFASHPESTRSMPGKGMSAFAPSSTSAVPVIVEKGYKGTFDSQDDTRASSEDFRSLSSRSSRTDSHAHTPRPSMMTGTNLSGLTNEIRSTAAPHGVHDDFMAESAYSYGALRSAYASMSLGQLAADLAGEVSYALNLEKIQTDVNKVFSSPSNASPKKATRRSFGCSELVPFDEEDVAIEVEYMEDSLYDEDTTQGPAFGKGFVPEFGPGAEFVGFSCNADAAKQCGATSPAGQPSFEERPTPRRGRRVGEV